MRFSMKSGIFMLCCFFIVQTALAYNAFDQWVNNKISGEKIYSFSSPLLTDVYNKATSVKLRNGYIDVSDIVEQYTPLGSSEDEVVKQLKENELQTIKPLENEKNTYFASFVYRDYNKNSRSLRIFLYFSSQKKLLRIRAVTNVTPKG